MIVYIPFESFGIVNPIVKLQQARIEKFTAENNPQAPLLKFTVWLVSFFFPFWGTMSTIAGLALLAIAKPLFNGERWNVRPGADLAIDPSHRRRLYDCAVDELCRQRPRQLPARSFDHDHRPGALLRSAADGKN